MNYRILLHDDLPPGSRTPSYRWDLGIIDPIDPEETTIAGGWAATEDEAIAAATQLATVELGLEPDPSDSLSFS